MGVSGRARFYSVSTKKFTMGPGGNPSGPVWKKHDFCGPCSGAENTKPVPSVGIWKHLGPKDTLGSACYDPNCSRLAILIGRSSLHFCNVFTSLPSNHIK